MNMGMHEARLRLMRHLEGMQGVIRMLGVFDDTLKNAHRAMVSQLNAVEGQVRENLNECRGMAGAGINPDEMEAMIAMYATALENTDRIRALLLSLTGIPKSMANVRANLSTANHAIRKALGS